MLTCAKRFAQIVATAWVFCCLVTSSGGASAQDYADANVPSLVVVPLEDGGKCNGDGTQSFPLETAQEAFDAGIDKMPVPFHGNTVDWVLRFGTLAPRRRSETASAYAARRQSFRSEVFAFIPGNHDFEYDRTSETLTVTVRPAFARVTSKPDYYFTAFDIHRTKLPSITRAGATTWSRNDRPSVSERGAVLSTKRVSIQTQIITNESQFNVSNPPLMFVLKMSRARAKLAKSNLTVALVCMPRLEQYEPAGDVEMPEATSVDRKIDHSGQSTDERTTFFVALRCNLLQVWLFDRVTGEVYGRFTPQGVFVPRE